MSEKKVKGTIKYPQYDVNSQLEFINDVCTTMNFDSRQLLTLIFADWICTLQESAIKSNQGYQKCFLAFIKHSMTTYDKLCNLRKEILKNGKN